MVCGTTKNPWRSRAPQEKVVRVKETLKKEMKMKRTRREDERTTREESARHPPWTTRKFLNWTNLKRLGPFSYCPDNYPIFYRTKEPKQ